MRSSGFALVAGALWLGLAGWCNAQDDRALEQELSNHYIGKAFNTRRPYLNREVWFDQDGNITENPTPVCDSLYGRLAITRIRVRGDEVDVQATRSGLHPPMMGGKPVWPDYAVREIVLRYKAPSGWTAASFDRAFQASLQSRSRFDPLPAGAVAPPPGSDRRIMFLMNGEAVYRAGNGVTPPRAITHQDPPYTESARRARAGGIVMLRFIVNEDGSVSNVESAQPPLGFGLDQESVYTAQRWQFNPAMLDGKPVKVEVQAETSFCLY